MGDFVQRRESVNQAGLAPCCCHPLCSSSQGLAQLILVRNSCQHRSLRAEGLLQVLLPRAVCDGEGEQGVGAAGLAVWHQHSKQLPGAVGSKAVPGARWMFPSLFHASFELGACAAIGYKMQK